MIVMYTKVFLPNCKYRHLYYIVECNSSYMNKKHKFLGIICFTFFYFNVSSQNVKLHDSIYRRMVRNGLNYVHQIKSGDIENFKKEVPPKNTWTYRNLLQYKNALENNKTVYYDYYLQPLVNKDCYGFNFFALNTNNISKGKYYFVASVSMKVLDNNVIFLNSYLFTEKEPIKQWWLNMWGYFNSVNVVNIPKHYLLQIPPPPPFDND
jgi:hypothetical protein